MHIIVSLCMRRTRSSFPLLGGGGGGELLSVSNDYKDGPKVFTKVLKVPFAYLRSHGHASVIYLDDGYLQASTYEE